MNVYNVYRVVKNCDWSSQEDTDSSSSGTSKEGFYKKLEESLEYYTGSGVVLVAILNFPHSSKRPCRLNFLGK